MLPEGAKILDVQIQFDKPCLWALVNPENKLVKRKFRFAGTGHDITENPENLEFISTFQISGGRGIFHIFEIKEILGANENQTRKNSS